MESKISAIKYKEVIIDDDVQDKNTVKMESTTLETQQTIPKSEKNEEASNTESSSNNISGQEENHETNMSNSSADISSIQRNKIFVGGLPHDLTDQEFREFFENFGCVIDSFIMCDKQTRKSKGFGFVTFQSEQVKDVVLQNTFYQLRNKRVEVKPAKPRDTNIVTMQPNHTNYEPHGANYYYYPGGAYPNSYCYLPPPPPPAAFSPQVIPQFYCGDYGNFHISMLPQQDFGIHYNPTYTREFPFTGY